MITTQAAISPATISRYFISIGLVDAKSAAMMISHAFGFFKDFNIRSLKV
jgi:hypothetical protein